MTELALFELLALDCRVDTYGAVCYYNALGQLHRVHGPAVEYADGHREWWQHGRLHRLDGPAIERPDGSCEWYIDDKEFAKTEWQRVVTSMGSV